MKNNFVLIILPPSTTTTERIATTRTTMTQLRTTTSTTQMPFTTMTPKTETMSPESSEEFIHARLSQRHSQEHKTDEIRTILRPLDNGTESCKCECSAVKEKESDRHESVTKIIQFKEKSKRQGLNKTIMSRFPGPKFDTKLLTAYRDFVWVAISVLAGKLDDPIKYSMADKAVIILEGINYDEQFSQGYIPEKTSYPYYPGAVFLRIPNPKRRKDSRTETAVKVYALDGSVCKSYCYKGSTGYVRCPSKIILDQVHSRSDPMPTAKFPIQIPFLQWQGKNTKKKDYHLFLCDRNASKRVRNKLSKSKSEQSIRRSPKRKCRFQKFEDFMLVGFAEKTRRNITLNQCKDLCRESADHKMHCGSIMYWTKSRQNPAECVIATETRKTHPRLFQYTPRDKVTYFDYICDTEALFED